MSREIIPENNGKKLKKPERKPISKRVRFEVFKRDKFSCQYCGASAPDVVLHVDHITPVSKGGENDLLNLITACESCNLGKSNVLLADDAAVAKQRAMLEELSEKREQLEMMLAWREELKGFDDEVYDRFETAWCNHFPGWSVNEQGEKVVRALIKSVGIVNLLNALDTAAEKYFDELRPDESVQDVFNRMQGIAKASTMPRHTRQLFYIRGICRNRFNYVNERMCIALLKKAYDLGYAIEDLADVAKEARNWTEWRTEMQELLEEDE